VPTAGADAPSTRLLVGLVSVVGALTLWQLVTGGLNLLNPLSFPSTVKIVEAFAAQLGSANLWFAIGDTLQSWALGLAICIAIALPLGLLLGTNDWLFRSSRLVIEFLKPMPSIAILPLALLLFGPTLRMKLLLICIGTIWPLLLQVIYGSQDVDAVVMDTARAFKLTTWERLRFIRLPSAAPFLATGLRLAATDALILSIVAELVGGGKGLGLSLSLAEYAAALPQMYAIIIVMGLLGLGMNGTLSRVERRVLWWHQSQRPAAA
jgi:ABC-type nitrate/sulfonate/bicarbonate transport system permease component